MLNLFDKLYKPDVLSCLADLSNDEVMTPPGIANKMLDLLPQEIFSNPNTKILDPFCKSGVFLREAAKRFIDGEKDQFASLQECIDWVFQHQLYGIAITELTSLLSRRSVYCSKYPNSPYSITVFDNDNAQGNILYHRMKHEWEGNGDKRRCKYCGVSANEYDRDSSLESYAYELLHTESPEEIFNMKFDVIIGNPPYQLGSNDERNNSRDKPIYNLFVDQAKKLNPKYLVMIIPSRWMASGLGLTDFRKEMLADDHIRVLNDYPVASEVFTGVEIKGGVCYFLWDRDNKGTCRFTTTRDGVTSPPAERNLNEYDVLVRDTRALTILKKILSKKEKSITDILSVDKEFGWTSNYDGYHLEKRNNDIPFYYNRQGKRLQAWIERKNVNKSTHLIDTWKVMIPQAGSDGGQKIPDIVLGTPFVAASPSVCTQTYLFIYTDSEEKAINIEKYVHTKFFRFLVSLRKITQHATRSTYTWVPVQDFSKSWTDKDLYKKYELEPDEIEYIESMVKSMDSSGGDD